jgi:hypothetical protein
LIFADGMALHNAIISLATLGGCMWSGLMVFQVLLMRDSCNWRFDSIEEVILSVKKWFDEDSIGKTAGLTSEGEQKLWVETLKKRVAEEASVEAQVELRSAISKIEEISRSYVPPHRAFLTGFFAVAFNFIGLAVVGVLSASEVRANILSGALVTAVNIVLGIVFSFQTLRALRCY